MVKALYKITAVAAMFMVAFTAAMLAFGNAGFGTPPSAYADSDLTGGVIDTGDDAFELAKALIGQLPADPEEIDATWEPSVNAAASSYAALDAEERATLDATIYKKEQTYGRWLESAQWGLAAHYPVDSTTSLIDGDYTKHANSQASMGKSTSTRAKSWLAEAVKVEKGQAIVTVSCDSESAFRTMRLGGTTYATDLVDGVPKFTVPLPLNATTCFLADTTDQADSIAYQITVSVPMTAATASDIAAAKKKASGITARKLGQYEPSSASAIRQAAKDLSAALKKEGVTATELQVATEALDNILSTAVKRKTNEKKNASRSTASSSGARAGEVLGVSAGKAPGRTTPQASGKQRTNADPSSQQHESVKDKDRPTRITATAGDNAASTLHDAQREASSEPSKNPAEPSDWAGLMLGCCITTLFLLGMCIRSVLFMRAKVVA